MKVCFTTFCCQDWSLPQIIKAARQFHYHGVELRCDAGHGHGVEVWTSANERKVFRKQIEKSDLQISCLASSLQFIDDDVRDRVDERFKLAADMGARGIRVFCGPQPEYMHTFDEVVEKVRGNLAPALELAYQLELEIWFETHDAISKGVDAAKLVKQINHPLVGICYNNLHPVREGEHIQTTLDALYGLIKHVHFHDGMNSPDEVLVKHLGDGEMPILETITGLAKHGYAEFLSGEWFYNHLADDPNDALEEYMYSVRDLTQQTNIQLGLGL
jgi:sugar phosphate isomerase/epimerase